MHQVHRLISRVRHQQINCRCENAPGGKSCVFLFLLLFFFFSILKQSLVLMGLSGKHPSTLRLCLSLTQGHMDVGLSRREHGIGSTLMGGGTIGQLPSQPCLVKDEVTQLAVLHMANTPTSMRLKVAARPGGFSIEFLIFISLFL